ncbi:MAG TPA: transporter [Vicinamibacterales bacterium]
MKRQFAIVLMAACIAGWSARADAQQRPLVTEDPETIGSGLILIEGGFDSQYDVFYPVSGLHGDLLRFPTLGVSIGISPIAELQIDGGLYNRLNVTSRQDAPLSGLLDFTGDRTSDVEDLVIGTKIRMLSEKPSRPSFGVRFATKLPNASNESGLGLDTTDFYASLLVGKTVQSIRFVGNAGLGILGDPTDGNRQNDVLTYGVSLARAVQQGLEVVGEVNGRLNTRSGDDIPPGTETRGAMRAGVRFTKGTVRIDGGIIVGMTSRDPGFGFTAGATWVFRGFTIQ